MENGMILLVENDPNDELLNLPALRMSNIKNKISVVRDGVDALDFLFCRNAYFERDPHDLPQLILLDIKLPELDGLEVLRRLRADRRTHLLPVVILSSSNEEQHLKEAYGSGASSSVRKPADFTHFMEYMRQLGLYWLELNESHPK